jgi:hypothetical protein
MGEKRVARGEGGEGRRVKLYKQVKEKSKPNPTYYIFNIEAGVPQEEAIPRRARTLSSY